MNSRSHEPTRRGVLKAGLATAAAWSASSAVGADDRKAAASQPAAVLPTRKLGRSGISVSVLNLGTAFDLRQDLLDHCWDRGVRYFDTADCYPDPEHIGGSERAIAKWFERTGRRKDMFLVTKCHPRGGPSTLPRLLDERLAVLKTDYVDLLFIHAIKFSEYGRESLDWVKGGELKTVAEKMKKSGKVRLIGFSSHDPEKSQYLVAAARGGFIDACMVKYDPRISENDEMNRALDAAHKAGIGIIAMKTLSSAGAFEDRWSKEHKGSLSVQQAIIKTVLSDERLSGMTSQMSSTKIIDDNTAVARDARQLAFDDRELLRRLYAAGPHRLCERCNGACAAAIGRPSALHDVARFVMYHEHYGMRRMARQRYRAIPRAQLDFTAQELARARDACHDRIDYPALMDKARRWLA